MTLMEKPLHAMPCLQNLGLSLPGCTWETCNAANSWTVLFAGLCRGDLQPGEDHDDFSPNYLRKRKPSLAMVALFAILDPPRDEAIQAAKIAHEAGITVKMITGATGGQR